MTDTAPPDATAIAGLLARHAPQGRRFLAWEAGGGIASLLAAARRLGPPDWLLALEPGEDRIAPLLDQLPPDPCLHLRGHPSLEPPIPGFAHPILQPAAQGLRPEVVLLGGAPAPGDAMAAAQALVPGGLLLMPPPSAEHAAAIDGDLQLLDHAQGLVALRPRQSGPPTPARPPGRHAIVVTVIGAQAEAEWEITGPSIRAYAAAIDAELVVSRDAAGLPRLSIKSAVLPMIERFDRILLMDADILVRPHAPDLFAIVPPEKVGAYPEGRHFPRAPVVAEATALHGVPAFPPEDYFNAGLLVLSRAHLGVLHALTEGVAGGRMAEQDTINVALRRLGLPLHRLTPEFNLIATGRNLADWRCGWLLHTAGAPKAGYRRRHWWVRHSLPRGTGWTAEAMTGRGLRLPHMAAQAARLAGEEARALDPDMMEFDMPRAVPRRMPDGVAAAWMEPVDGALALTVTGRFEGLSAGLWRLCALPLPGAALPAAIVEARLPGAAAPLLSGPLQREIAVELPADAKVLDIAFGASGPGGGLAGLVLRRPLPGQDPA